MKSLFIFRRDIRIQDNIALYEALKQSEKVYAVFIFTPEQINNNKYKSNLAAMYLCEYLLKLNIKLNIFYGDTIEVLNRLVRKYDIDTIFFNKDYTPYAVQRDTKICKHFKTKVYEDVLLLPMGTIVKDDKKPYLKYTPFYNKAKTKLKHIPKPIKISNLLLTKIKFMNDSKQLSTTRVRKFYEKTNVPLKKKDDIFNNLKKYNDYETNRDLLTYKTTNISIFLRLGIISVREAYYEFLKITNIKSRANLIRQLIWREFYYYLIYYYPKLMFEGNIKRYNNIKWINNKTLYTKWQKGETGFPIVDASIKELLATGNPHNRARLIIASFIVYIGVDWRFAAAWFASKLHDADIAINYGNWQWCISISTFSQPYFRLMNFVSQTKRYDPHCEYIKRYLPQLRKYDAKDIINNHITKVYNVPECLDLEEAKKAALKRYKNAR